MQALVLVQENKMVTTSKLIATTFEKSHKHVLRDIETLECSDIFRQSNFGLTSIDTPMPLGGFRKDPIYNITRDGFSFLAMGYTGKKAAEFKEAYINAFNEMEKQLTKNRLPEHEVDLIAKLDNLIEVVHQANVEFEEKFKALEERAALRNIITAPISERYTVKEYAEKFNTELPSGMSSVIAKMAIKWHKDKKIPFVNSQYTVEALELAFTQHAAKQEAQKKKDIKFLTNEPIAQELKLLEVDEYMIFHAKPIVSLVVNLINKHTDLHYESKYRSHTMNRSYKVTRKK